MSVQVSGNAEGFGFHSPGPGISGGSSEPVTSSAPPAAGMGVSPHPAIGASINYVQGLQGESRNQTFAQGSQEGKSTGGGGSGVMSKIKGLFGGGEGDAEAGGAAESAGAGLAEDAAIVAV